MATRWLAQTTDGWIVTLDSAGTRRSLPSHLELDVTGTAAGRELFRVLEGVHATTTGSIAVGSGLLSATDPHRSTATVRFRNRTGGPRTIGGVRYDKEIVIEFADGNTTRTVGPFNAIGDSTNPIPVGTHVLQVPDFPHDLGRPYGTRGTVWFRIGTSGDRYLHPGTVSAGCATAEAGSWDAIYDAIIRRRNTSNDVGSLIAS